MSSWGYYGTGESGEQGESGAVSVQISGHIAGWHGQTRLPVESRRSRRCRNSTVKPVWRCQPTPEYLHTHVAPGRRVRTWERSSMAGVWSVFNLRESAESADESASIRVPLRFPWLFVLGALCGNISSSAARAFRGRRTVGGAHPCMLRATRYLLMPAGDVRAVGWVATHPTAAATRSSHPGASSPSVAGSVVAPCVLPRTVA